MTNTTLKPNNPPGVTAVRYGRVPKRSRPQSEDKEDARVSTSDSSEPLPLPEPDSKNVGLYDIILSVAQAHQAHCEYTEEQTRSLLRKPISSAPVSTLGKRHTGNVQ